MVSGPADLAQHVFDEWEIEAGTIEGHETSSL